MQVLNLYIFLACQQQELPMTADANKQASPPIPKALTFLRDHALSDDGGYKWLEGLCDDIGHRLTGSPQLDAAIEYGVDTFNSMGLSNVRKQATESPKWVRGEESLDLLSPQTRSLSMLGLGMSVGTPADGISAPVVVVSNFDELKALPPQEINGKIVLYNAPFTTYGKTVQYRTQGAKEAVKLGAIGTLVRSVTPSSLSTPHTGSTGYGDGPKIPAAAVTVEDAEQFARWQAQGKDISVRLHMSAKHHGMVPSANVMAEITGSTEDTVALGCHLDSWDVGQGAQDDGAGCAVVIAAMKSLQALKKVPKRSIRVVLFTNEENGLTGGRSYAATISRPHFAAIEADIGAGPPQHFSYKLPEDVVDAEWTDLQDELKWAEKTLSPLGMGDMQKGYAGADINPLVKNGSYGFGLRMDTTGYWPIHHTHADTLDKINPENLKKNAAAIAVWAWVLAN